MKEQVRMKALMGTLMVGAALTIAGCQKPEEAATTTPTPTPTPVLSKIPENFSFQADQDVNFRISALNNRNLPMNGVPFMVYSLPDNVLLFKGVTTSGGLLAMKHRLGNHVKQVDIRTDYPGLPNSQVIDLTGNNITVTFGGTSTGGRIAAGQTVSAEQAMAALPTVQTLGTWTTSGLPNYLVSNTPDAIEQAFYDRIRVSLPESKPLTTTHPEYLANNAPATLSITELADVWVTFVTEGAGWKNTLGFYTFDPANPPTSDSQVQNPTIIFPNVSFAGSGGSLVSGHRVKIGRFPAGTHIGFFLIGDAFNDKNGTVGTGNYVHYSHSNLNVETTEAKRRHFVVLDDSGSDRILLAAEDVSRDNKPIVCDNDFNDAVFYITSNPVTAISTTDLPKTDVPVDTDNDGIPDDRDEYPTDPKRAFNSYTPGKNVYGTLAYEDLWPNKGDYDFNDLVMNYNFQEVLNAQNEIVEIKTKLKVNAIGASYRNGWGLQLPVLPSNIKSVSTKDMRTNVTKTLEPETGQAKATIVAFENAFDKILRVSTTHSMVNTVKYEPNAASHITTLDIEFGTPVTRATLGTAPYNPFLISNSTRGREIHFANYRPTDKVNALLFGTEDDRTNPGINKYYKDSNNMPWALNLPVEFSHPYEQISILDTYLHFFEWASSGGSQYTDWYMNKTGYRKAANIYQP